MSPMARFRFLFDGCCGGVAITRVKVVAGAVVLAALTRLLPHPHNFAPITAIALFAAATFNDRRLAIVTPLLALFVSDLGIEAMHRLGLMASWAIYPGMWVTYLAMLLITLMGFLLRGHRTAPAVAGATLAGSVVFYVVTNFLVWAGGDLYPHTLAGLVTCFELAIPFFQNAVLGDMVYCAVLFGGFALAERRLPLLRELPSARPVAG
jgi:hypothetical protein